MTKYSNEVKAFIAANVAGRTTKELVKLVNETFDIDFTENKMKAYKSNHKLKSGTPRSIAKGKCLIYSDETQEFIKQNYKGITNQELTDKVNEKFNTNYTAKQIKAYKHHRKLDSGLTGQFEPGIIPANKGKKMTPEQYEKCKHTMFKKGQKAHNKRPIGSERIDSKDGYILIKIAEPNKWVLKHVYTWEQHFGKVPPGHCVIFLDNNRLNTNIENLALVSQSELLIINQRSLKSSNPEITKIGVNIAKVKNKVYETKRKRG